MNDYVRKKWQLTIQAMDTEDLKLIRVMINKELGE